MTDKLTIACDNPAIPADESNLALRAARHLAKAAGIRGRGAHIVLHKHIPTGAGLGGGSSNAATTLALLNRLWSLALTPARLADIGAEIGSDVPLFFHTPLCIARGRGERVEDTPQSLAACAVLMLPELHAATPAVYAAWDRLGSKPARPTIDDILAHAGDVEQLMPHLFNDLEAAAFSGISRNCGRSAIN